MNDFLWHQENLLTPPTLGRVNTLTEIPASLCPEASFLTLGSLLFKFLTLQQNAAELDKFILREKVCYNLFAFWVWNGDTVESIPKKEKKIFSPQLG